MPVSTEAPLRLSSDTKEKVQIAAAILGLKQSEFVQRAVAEYLDGHADELGERFIGAQNKLGVLNSAKR